MFFPNSKVHITPIGVFGPQDNVTRPCPTQNPGKVPNFMTAAIKMGIGKVFWLYTSSLAPFPPKLKAQPPRSHRRIWAVGQRRAANHHSKTWPSAQFFDSGRENFYSLDIALSITRHYISSVILTTLLRSYADQKHDVSYHDRTSLSIP